MFNSWLESFGQSVGLGDVIKGESTWQHVVASLRRNPIDSVYDLTCEALCRICLLLIYQGLAELYGPRGSDITQRLDMLSTAATCAAGLYHTTALLEAVAESPVCRAVATRGPLHFLGEWYSHCGDDAGAQRCAETSASVCASAPYLHWGAVLPWSLLPLIRVPR